MTLERRIEIERAIVKKICDDAIARGYMVSLHDGTWYTVGRTREVAEIMDGLMTTDIESLVIRDANAVRLGTIFLVYGNTGWDVISDYTDNKAINELLVGANELAETFENEE